MIGNYHYTMGGIFDGTLPSGKPIPIGWWLIIGLTALTGYYKWRERRR